MRMNFEQTYQHCRDVLNNVLKQLEGIQAEIVARIDPDARWRTEQLIDEYINHMKNLVIDYKTAVTEYVKAAIKANKFGEFEDPAIRSRIKAMDTFLKQYHILPRESWYGIVRIPRAPRHLRPNNCTSTYVSYEGRNHVAARS